LSLELEKEKEGNQVLEHILRFAPSIPEGAGASVRGGLYGKRPCQEYDFFFSGWGRGKSE